MSQIVQVKFPPMYQKQQIFWQWETIKPKAQVLIIPAGVKTGKSFGAASWLMRKALSKPNQYCIWVAPTYFKSKIGYRYCKRYVPDIKGNDCVDGALEIRLNNGSFIKFIHGSDPETTLEGENVDAFVIDESGKTSQQIYYSLITTITQRKGKGIITGTPRGRNWYYHEYRKAVQGDPFYHHGTLITDDSPFVPKSSIEHARRLLPPNLFDQYYMSKFVMESSVFGDLSKCFYGDPIKNIKFWIHPDPGQRSLETVTGYDPAKLKDHAVFFTVNELGAVVGYARFFRVPYDTQVTRLKHYLHKYFTGEKTLRYDATGVGEAVGEMIVEKDIDANIYPVTFTNKSKMQMINRLQLAIEQNWLKSPYIPEIEHEFSGFEVNITKSGLFQYSAPEGEHDDIVSAAMLSVSAAYESSMADERDSFLEDLMNGKASADDFLGAISDLDPDDNDNFFDDNDKLGEDIDINDLETWS